jgi:hypothetical protein
MRNYGHSENRPPHGDGDPFLIRSPADENNFRKMIDDELAEQEVSKDENFMEKFRHEDLKDA